jgi:hypothetical protein
VQHSHSAKDVCEVREPFIDMNVFLCIFFIAIAISIAVTVTITSLFTALQNCFHNILHSHRQDVWKSFLIIMCKYNLPE